MKTNRTRKSERGTRKHGSDAVSAARTIPPEHRECLRCGCTEDNACACGCSWVYGCDVCDACLTFEEKLIYTRLLSEFEVAEHPILEKRAQNRLKAFATFLTQLIDNEPLPYVVVKGGGK